MTKKQTPTQQGLDAYQRWVNGLSSNPTYQTIYDKEARKSEIWLALVEARKEAGFTQAEVAQRMGVSQAQIARIEKKGYGSYTIRTLQRYLKALGNDYELDFAIRKSPTPTHYAVA